MFLNLAGTCAAATAATGSTLTYVIRIAAHACAIAVSACNHQKLRLPRVRSTHARIISITGGNVPAVRHLHRLPQQSAMVLLSVRSMQRSEVHRLLKQKAL